MNSDSNELVFKARELSLLAEMIIQHRHLNDIAECRERLKFIEGAIQSDKYYISSNFIDDQGVKRDLLTVRESLDQFESEQQSTDTTYQNSSSLKSGLVFQANTQKLEIALEDFFNSHFYLNFALVMLIRFVVISILLYWFWKKSMAKINQLQSVVDATKLIAKDDYDINIDLKLDSEVAVLGQSVLEMNRKLKQKREENLQLIDSEKNLNRHKNRLFSIIGHDLRNPLAGIKTMSEFLSKNRRKLDDKTIDNTFSILNRSINSVVSLLEGLLAWSSSLDKSQPVKMMKVDAAETIDLLIELFLIQPSQKDIKIHNHIPPDTFIYTDDEMFRTIFRNLISNSLKFVETGGKIDVLSEVSAGICQISVRDNGVGIDKEALSKLNEGLKHTTKGTNGELGNGLGLMLCKEYADKCGYGLLIKSEEGVGTTISVAFAVFKGEDQPYANDEALINAFSNIANMP